MNLIGNNSVRLVISPSTKSLFEDCRKEFMEYNKSFDGMFLTQDFLLRRICNYYLDKDLDESSHQRKRG